MSCLIPHGDMSADEIMKCCSQAKAIISLCERAAWAIQNGEEAAILSDNIYTALPLARELIDAAHYALEATKG